MKTRRSGGLHRLEKIGIFIGVLFFALTLRLAYIQLAGHEDLSAAVRAQSMIALEGSNTRGIIYDRNGAPLVADEKHYIYIIKDEDMTVGAVEQLEKIGANLVSSDNEGYHVYSSDRYDKAAGSKLVKENKAYILQAAARYGEDQTAAHLIGYVNSSDHSGAAGLELMYDDILGKFDRNVYAAADVRGNILPGRGLIITSDGGLDSYISEGIRTTIDKDLQTEVEEIIGGINKDCAAIVMEAETGGIMAMACTPKFDPDNVNDIITGSGDELINKATQGEYPPGSIFKIVTAAAALESGVKVGKEYDCDGIKELEEISVRCDTGGDEGHGTIAMEEAFAKSCNSYFIELGNDVGAEKIIDTAEAMGLGKKVLIGYPHESSGHLMTERESKGDAIGNLCIGQGEILVTPLQIAAMTNIIANKGIDKGVHLLMNDEQEEHQVISANTADTIKKMMTATVEDGTAALSGFLDQNGSPKAAMKTGTAEYATSNGMQSHGWMTGFTPCDEPEYVITVFVENGGSGSASAGPVIEKIIDYLIKSGGYSMPTLA